MSNDSKTFMFILRGGASPEDLTPEQRQQLIKKYTDWMGQLGSRGQLKGGEPLEDEGKVLSGKGGKVITDGPFAEVKEQVGGYFMILAKDLNEAAEIARGCPIFENGGTIEVRPIQVMPGM